MSNAFSRPSSRREFLLMGIVAAAGAFSGCGDTSVNKVQEPTPKGNLKRLEMLGQKAEAALKNNKKK
jgi:hypothetical protein